MTDEQIFQRDGFKCVYCDFDAGAFRTWAFLQVDHFKPKSAGGSLDEPSNRVTSCIICNNMKGAAVYSSLEEAREKIQGYWSAMQAYWEKNVKPLTPAN
jgi:5-methylcytosine-specific restriction endonuclease McrA